MRKLLYAGLIAAALPLASASADAAVKTDQSPAPSPQCMNTALPPISQPISSKQDVVNWTARAITKAYAIDFGNWQAEMAQAKENFTPAGWRGFRTALDLSGNLQTIIRKDYVVSAVPTGVPVLLTSGLVGNRFAYKLEMPLLVTYQDESGVVESLNLKVTIVALRVAGDSGSSGLGISQLIAE